jgi:L-lactate dehydrogenase complex protein LldE
MSAKPKPRVGLFVTCLVDAIRPGIGFAAIQLLEEAGCRIEVPQGQTCCGQPALNSGDDTDAAHRRLRGVRSCRAALGVMRGNDGSRLS